MFWKQVKITSLLTKSNWNIAFQKSLMKVSIRKLKSKQRASKTSENVDFSQTLIKTTYFGSKTEWKKVDIRKLKSKQSVSKTSVNVDGRKLWINQRNSNEQSFEISKFWKVSFKTSDKTLYFENSVKTLSFKNLSKNVIR